METALNHDQIGVIMTLSIFGAYGFLLAISKRYRIDSIKMFKMEKSSIQVAIEHPLAVMAHILSVLVPPYLMGRPF